MSFCWNLQIVKIKKTTIHVKSTPSRRLVEYHEGLGIKPAPVLDCTGAMLILISIEYTEIGLNRFRTWYQSGTISCDSISTVVKSIVVASNPTNTIGRIILKRNHRKIAPPRAVDRFEKTVEKNNATVKKTNPNTMVRPIKSRYSR